MHEMPRGLLSDPEMAGYFVATHAILAGDDQPNGEHPFIHAQRRILEDAANFDGELLLASLAEPDTASADVGVFFRFTTRASNTIRPTQRYGKLVSTLWIGEVYDSLLKTLGKLAKFVCHASSMRHFALCVKYIVALICNVQQREIAP